MTQHTGSSLWLQLDKNWCWTYQALSPWIEYPLLHRCITGLWSLSVQPLSGPMSCHNVAKVPQSLMCISMSSSNTHKKAVRAYLMLRFACAVGPAASVRTFWLRLLLGHSHVWRPVCILSLFQSCLLLTWLQGWFEHSSWLNSRYRFREVKSSQYRMNRVYIEIITFEVNETGGGCKTN